MQHAPRLTLKEALARILDPAGKTIVDVGCGDGAIVRHLQRLGGLVTGVEISERQLERARKSPAIGHEAYKVGCGEALPFTDESADAILYINSFHHVPVESMGQALAEARRVLKANGELIAIEPLAEGSYFEAMRPLEDETGIRAAAYRHLQNAAAEGFSDILEMFYESRVQFRDVQHFLTAVVAPDPARRDRLPLVQKELERRFESLAVRDEEGFILVSPMRLNALRKQA